MQKAVNFFSFYFKSLQNSESNVVTKCTDMVKIFTFCKDLFRGFNEEVQHLGRPGGYSKWLWRRDTGS